MELINAQLLEQAHACYIGLDRFRRDRERNKRYNYGDQWGDIITVDGHTMSEEQYIREQGSEPLKNNLIRRLVRNVIGVYSAQDRKVACHGRGPHERKYDKDMTQLMRNNAELNRLGALHVRSLEEFLISGMVVHRKWYGSWRGVVDCWTDYVHPNNFFIDANMRDFRGWDCACVGEVHDVDFPTLCSQFAHSAADYEQLKKLYVDGAEASGAAIDDFGYNHGISQSFLKPQRPGMYRVIEVWRKEFDALYRCHDPLTGQIYKVKADDYERLVAAENARRGEGEGKIAATWSMDEVWRYYFLSPMGHVLAQGDSPYAHGGHPYVVKAYPLIDGEIHAFVSDVIDQQRYTNRLITMYDWVVRSSAKGVLLVPEDCMPRGVNPRQFADTWSRFNGVLVYKPSTRGEMPRQVNGNTNNAGIVELLNLQLKFFEEISGVNGALEGKLANSAMSAELYGQQTQNATMALLDLLNTYYEFMRDGAQKDLSNMQQFYRDLPPLMRRATYDIKIE